MVVAALKSDFCRESARGERQKSDSRLAHDCYGHMKAIGGHCRGVTASGGGFLRPKSRWACHAWSRCRTRNWRDTRCGRRSNPNPARHSPRTAESWDPWTPAVWAVGVGGARAQPRVARPRQPDSSAPAVIFFTFWALFMASTTDDRRHYRSQKMKSTFCRASARGPLQNADFAFYGSGRSPAAVATADACFSAAADACPGAALAAAKRQLPPLDPHPDGHTDRTDSKKHRTHHDGQTPTHAPPPSASQVLCQTSPPTAVRE